MKVSASILWFDDLKGYGFATTQDGRKVFVHRNNFLASQRKQVISSLVQGSIIECEIQEASVRFTEALNSGSLRDAGMNHRRPKLTRPPVRHPAALRVEVVEL